MKKSFLDNDSRAWTNDCMEFVIKIPCLQRVNIILLTLSERNDFLICKELNNITDFGYLLRVDLNFSLISMKFQIGRYIWQYTILSLFNYFGYVFFSLDRQMPFCFAKRHLLDVMR